MKKSRLLLIGIFILAGFLPFIQNTQANSGSMFFSPGDKYGLSATVGNDDHIGYEVSAVSNGLDIYAMTQSQWADWNSPIDSYYRKLHTDARSVSGVFRPPSHAKWYIVLYYDGATDAFVMWDSYFELGVYNQVTNFIPTIVVIVGVIVIIGLIIGVGIAVYYRRRNKWIPVEK